MRCQISSTPNQMPAAAMAMTKTTPVMTAPYSARRISDRGCSRSGCASSSSRSESSGDTSRDEPVRFEAVGLLLTVPLERQMGKGGDGEDRTAYHPGNRVLGGIDDRIVVHPAARG